MTQDDVSAAMSGLQADMQTLTAELKGLVEFEKQRHQADALQKRRHEDSQRRQMEMELKEYQEKQKFLSRHGGKILSVLFSAAVAGLAWYGAGIRSDLQAEQRAKKVDNSIESNTLNLKSFKMDTEKDIQQLQMDSLTNTLIMNEGFDRIDKLFLKATRLNEEDLPARNKDLDDAITVAKCRKEGKAKGYPDVVIDLKCRNAGQENPPP